MNMYFFQRKKAPAVTTDELERQQCEALGINVVTNAAPGLDDQAVDETDRDAVKAQREAVALVEAYRSEIHLADQLALDESIARSLYAKDERRLLRMSETGILDEDDDESTSNGELLERKPAPSCVCCTVELHDLLTRRILPCGHLYCEQCVATRCRMAVLDRSLVPAHCCKKEFPVEYVRDVLSATDLMLYNQFLAEKDWRMLDLESDREYANTVQAAGGKQCPGCGIGVQLVSGCHHMRCCNGHEFCFSCGRKWKTCSH